VRTLSEESLCWHELPRGVCLFGDQENVRRDEARVHDLVQRILLPLSKWEPGAGRAGIFEHVKAAQAALNRYLYNLYKQRPDGGPSTPPQRVGELLRKCLRADDKETPGTGNRFSVANLRPARRIGPNGEFRREMVFEVVRSIDLPLAGDGNTGPTFDFRGGVTFIVSMDDWRVRYVIYKRLDSPTRQRRQREYEQQAPALGFGAAEYHCGTLPADWETKRATDREAMRASSCACRGRTRKQHLVEPFAMLHRHDDDLGDGAEPPRQTAQQAGG
jgi:hypothetical protein